MKVYSTYFFTGETVNRCTQRFDNTGNIDRGFSFSTLKKHMLEEMGNTLLFRIFITTARPEKETDCSGMKIGHFFGYQFNAGINFGFLDSH
jgi:hypothetical protein